MATPSDLTKTGAALVYALINAANASLPNGALDATNTTLGAPTASGGSPNTNLTVTAKAGQGYSGSVTVNYNRLDIDADVLAILAPAGATVVNNGYTTVADLLPAINTAYSLNLQASDISNGSDALSLTDGAGSATVTIASDSLTYTGSVSVAITQEQFDLATEIAVTTLDGLTAPAAPSP